MKFLEPVTEYYRQSLVIIATTMMASAFRYPQMSYQVIPIQDNDAIWLKTICLDDAVLPSSLCTKSLVFGA